MPLDKERVKDAPQIEPDGELSPEEERRLWEHYGMSDYDEWQGEDRTTALALPDQDEDRTRRSPAGSDPDGGPAIVGVRLRRVILAAIPVGEAGRARRTTQPSAGRRTSGKPPSRGGRRSTPARHGLPKRTWPKPSSLSGSTAA